MLAVSKLAAEHRNRRRDRGLGFRAPEAMRRLSPAELDAERRLVEAAQADPARFGELYERYVDAIYSFSYHQTGSHQQAEEVTAETFERALKHLPRYRWRGVPYSALLY